jgi:hypothetical protein
MRCVRELCVERDLDVATVGTVLAVVAEGLLDRLVIDLDADQLLTDLAVSGASLADGRASSRPAWYRRFRSRSTREQVR